MKNVLIVDDEANFLLSLSDGLSLYAGEFNVLTAENGREAMGVLESVPVDPLVTDLKMPVMDGFELLSYMSKCHPKIPVIVMTAFSTPETESRIKNFAVSHYLEKPLDFRDLANRMVEELEGSSKGYIRGITLPSFIQLVSMEKKTCTLTIKQREKAGYLYFSGGDLIEAETGKLRGEEAACEIICWEKAEIDIEPSCRKRKKNIQSRLDFLLMDAFRIKDEKERFEETNPVPVAGSEEDVVLGSFELETPHLRKEEVMALESHLQGLKEVKGYKAAGIMNFTGEMLAYDSSDPKIDLALAGATFNDIFRSAHEASKKIGLEACRETVINTPKGVIVMHCSGTDAKAHFHVTGIMSNDGNQALMKMQIEKMVPHVISELA